MAYTLRAFEDEQNKTICQICRLSTALYLDI